MKRVTLNFREVEKDGLPKKSMTVYAYYGYGMQVIDFSAKNQCFGCCDNSDDETVSNARAAFYDVLYWCPYQLTKQLGRK